LGREVFAYRYLLSNQGITLIKPFSRYYLSTLYLGDNILLLESLKTEILLALVTKGTSWLSQKFVEKVQGNKPTLEEVNAFFQSGLDENKAHDLLQGFVNDLVKGVEIRFKESDLTGVELRPVSDYLEVLLSRLEITPQLISKYNYDPAALSRYAESLPRADEMASFSESQRLLVREVLRSLGAPLLRLGFDIPTSVSQFHSRSDELQQTINELRVDLYRARMIAEAQNPDRHLQEFERVYRIRLVESLNAMELLGLDEVRRNLRRYPLDAAFVHLRLDASRRSVSFQKALEEHPKLFLKGIAGSGKTTLMRWLAIMIARDKLDRYPHLKGKLPVLITLRDYNDTDLPSDLSGLFGKNHFMPPVSSEHLEEMIYERFRLGRVVVLIDGVDEVSESKLNAVRDWVKNLISTYPRASYVLSSRPVVNLGEWLGLVESRLPRDRFVETTVEKMNDVELADLVERWHKAAGRAADDINILPKSFELIQTFKHLTGLRELASTPLLASAICALNLNAAGGLPAKRRELYNGLIRMMIEKRDRERNLEDSLNLTLDQKILLLASIAARVVEEGGVRISREELTAVLKSRLAMTERRTDPEKVLLYLLERTGLIRQIDKDAFEFVHKTFQEFLAALSAVQEHKPALAGRHFFSQGGGDIAYFMAVLASDAGTIIISMLEELWDMYKIPYIDVNDRLLYIAQCVEDSVLINLEDGSRISASYQRLMNKLGKTVTQRNRVYIERKLASKLTLEA